MKTAFFNSDRDLANLRTWLAKLRPHSLVDFEEIIQLSSVQACTRLWKNTHDALVAVAYVDDYDNLWFEFSPADLTLELEDAMLNWGEACQRGRGLASLDACVPAERTEHVRILTRHGFTRTESSTLKYCRDLSSTLPDVPFPAGFNIRPVSGEQEAEALVRLHRSAFGSDQMTIEHRLAMMRTPTYDRSLDLLAIAPNGTPAAFCVASREWTGEAWIGSTDPIGTAPTYQKIGLAKSLVAHALKLLKARGTQKVVLGTSSENRPCRPLLSRLGSSKLTKNSGLQRIWRKHDLQNHRQRLPDAI